MSVSVGGSLMSSCLDFLFVKLSYYCGSCSFLFPVFFVIYERSIYAQPLCKICCIYSIYEHYVKYYFNTLKCVQCCLRGNFLRRRFDAAAALMALISFFSVTGEPTVRV